MSDNAVPKIELGPAISYKPWRSGFGSQDTVPTETYPIAELAFTSALADATRDRVFFTPAILYLREVIDNGVWNLIATEIGEMFDLRWTRFRNRLFRGLHRDDQVFNWDYVLWSVSRVFWSQLSSILTSIVYVSEGGRVETLRYGGQILPINDPNTLVPTPVDIVSFGVNGSAGCWALAYDYGGMVLPRLRQWPAQAEALSFHAAFLEGLTDIPPPVLSENMDHG